MYHGFSIVLLCIIFCLFSDSFLNHFAQLPIFAKVTQQMHVSSYLLILLTVLFVCILLQWRVVHFGAWLLIVLSGSRCRC